MKRFELLVNEKAYLVEVTNIDGDNAIVLVNGVKYEVGIKDIPTAAIPAMMAFAPTQRHSVPQTASAPPAQAEVETVGGLTTIKAPLPGLVIEVKVNVGDTVKAGDVILVIETMKMENSVISTRAGTIKEIRVTKNQSVNEGAPLIVIGD